MDIGASLKKIRLERGLTMKELAKTLGIPFRTYQNWELNLREPNVYAGLKISKFYGVTFERLFTYSEIDK